MTHPADTTFLNELSAITDAQIMWDPGEGSCGGYAINDVDDATVARLRIVARAYGMRLQHFRNDHAVWINRKGATFDRSEA
jgi:hypothetical protein